MEGMIMGLYKTTGPDTWSKIVSRKVPDGYIEHGNLWTTYQWKPSFQAFRVFCRPMIGWLEGLLAKDGKRLISVKARIEFQFGWAEKDKE